MAVEDASSTEISASTVHMLSLNGLALNLKDGAKIENIFRFCNMPSNIVVGSEGKYLYFNYIISRGKVYGYIFA